MTYHITILLYRGGEIREILFLNHVQSIDNSIFSTIVFITVIIIVNNYMLWLCHDTI